jgi:TRADD-N domain-containing protein
MAASVANAFRELFVDERFGAESGDPTDHDRVEVLREQRAQLKRRRAHLVSLRTTSLTVSMFSTLLVPVVVGSTSLNRLTLVIVAYATCFLAFGYVFRQRARQLGEDILEIDNELDRLAIGDESPERRAQKPFQLHSIELKRYYDQTLRQGSHIFWVGVACIALGFGVVGLTVWLLHGLGTSPLEHQIVLGGLGAVGGILANFIAVIYLKMYSETIRSMTQFHTRLVETHHLHFGSLLAARIKDGGLRESALRAMAESLTGKEAQVSSNGAGPEAGAALNGATGPK